jgi:Cys-tRNA(Pro)/Cys-tRNA(Cys) deacylase
MFSAAGGPTMRSEVETFLVAAGVDHKIHRHTSVVSYAEAKAALPFDPDASVKGLVFRLPSGGYAIIAMRGDGRADYKKIANALGVRRSDLKPATEAELVRDLGMTPGGVAPLPLGGATVLFDDRTLDLDVVYCGAGRPDATLEIKRADLVRVAGGAVADLTKAQ